MTLADQIRLEKEVVTGKWCTADGGIILTSGFEGLFRGKEGL